MTCEIFNVSRDLHNTAKAQYSRGVFRDDSRRTSACAARCVYLGRRRIRRGKWHRLNIELWLAAGLPARERTLQRVPEEGILKRSSAFLVSLAHHPSSDLAERYDESAAKFLGSSDGCELRSSSSTRNCSGLKGYFSILTSGDNGRQLRPLHQSTSVQTLSTSWKKKGVGVKKSVSFSSDTSFAEKRTPYRKPVVHEAKIYRKGVLQGEFPHWRSVLLC